MRQKVRSYSHWDYDLGHNDRSVTADSLAAHIALRPGVIVMIVMLVTATIICLCCSLFAGIIVLILLFVLLAIVLQASGLDLRSKISYIYFVLFTFALILFIQGRSADIYSRAYAASMYGQIHDIEGVVISVPPTPGNQKDNYSVRIILDNGCQVWLTGCSSKLLYGDHIRTKAKIYRPDKATNPGGFSQLSYLESKGIYAAGSIVRNEEIEVIQHAPLHKRVFAAAGLREKIFEVTGMILPEDTAKLLLAIFLGEDSLLDSATKISFRRCGIAHLTSVSGAHISFVLIPLSLITKTIKLGRRSAASMHILVLAVYGTLTGWNTGALRAFIMLTVMLSLKAADRNYDAINTLGLACSIMIIIDPYSIRQNGFWLSVGATTILTIAVIPLCEWVKTIVLEKSGIMLTDGIVYSLCTVIMLQLLLVPLSVKLTGEVFWLSWLYNIPSIFIVSIICTFSVFILPIMLLLINLLGPSFPLVVVLSRSAGLLLSSPILLLGKIARAGSLNQVRSAAADLNILIYLGGLIMLLSFWFSFIRKRRLFFGQIRMEIGVVILLAGLISMMIRLFISPVWSFYFLDVGQGDSLIIFNKKADLAILVDGGPIGSGYYDIVPTMADVGINKIDLAIVTHGHSDHVGGVIELIEMGLVKQIAVPETIEDLFLREIDYLQEEEQQSCFESDMTSMLIASCQQYSVPVQYWRKHDTISLPDSAMMTVLAPGQEIDLNRAVRDPNDASLIISFSWNQLDVLLLADLTETQEAALMPCWTDADLIKVAHHGSKFTTGELFLEKVLPDHAVISSGTNYYGHPAPEVVARLVEADCQVWRTDEGGCVIVELNEKNEMIRYYCR